ncbi:MAG: hypothetical protein ABI947_12200 [Chloroflexota bacterium]
MDAPSLTQQGIDAYKAGNKEEAVRLLSDALRQNNQDTEAWLYLGAAMDNPARKRQAFQKVLALDPANEKAKNALARLDTAEKEAGPAASKLGAEASARMNAAGNQINAMWSGQQGFKIPVEIEGAPASVTIPELIANAQTRIQQAIKIYTNQDYEEVVAGGRNATMWDSVFIAGVGVVAVGAAELIGRLIGWPLLGFHNGLYGLISPFFAAIISMVATAAGFAGAVYASRYYLQSQNINVSLPQHSMYYALVFLPLTLINAGFAFVSRSAGVLILCIAPILLIAGLVMLIYGWFLLKGTFDRIYGDGNNRGLITAAIAIFGGAIASGIVQAVLGGILRIGY